MKLRIKGNTIRIRMESEEVHRLAATGHVAEVTTLGATPGERFTYGLRASEDESGISATYRDGSIEILLPRKWIREWAETSRVGFEGIQEVGASGSLHILIEKDLGCLHEDVEIDTTR